MVTVVDPTGTPTIVYTKSGSSIVELSGSGSIQSGATLIPAVTGKTVVKALGSSGNTALILSEDFEIGDVVEVHPAESTYGVQVFPQSGGNFSSLSSNQGISMAIGGSKTLVKISSTEWLW